MGVSPSGNLKKYCEKWARVVFRGKRPQVKLLAGTLSLRWKLPELLWCTPVSKSNASDLECFA